MQYLPRIERARVLRRRGSVLILEKVALRRAMEKEYAGHLQRNKATVEYSNNGVAHSSRSSQVETAWEEDKKKEENGRF